jgi:hemoglobin-like flavoprotein
MVTSRQKALVQDSFGSLLPIAEDVAALFHHRLFELDPALRGMFPTELAPQRRKLAQMLTAAVKGLDRPEQLIRVVYDLGRRHVAYGVTDNHYETVGAALMWTLEKGLGRAFTPELEQAWAAVYGLLATTMKNAMRAETAAA